MGFFLGHGREEGEQKLGFHGAGADVFFFEDDPDPEGGKLADKLQTVCRISGEAADGFGENQVDFSGPAVFHQPVQLGPFFSLCAGDADLPVDPGHLPLRIIPDISLVMVFLVLNGGFLGILVCGHPAVGGDPKLRCFLRCGPYGVGLTPVPVGTCVRRRGQGLRRGNRSPIIDLINNNIFHVITPFVIIMYNHYTHVLRL